VRVGTRFELTREMLGLKLPMSYEVVELQPGKRLVLSGLSEHHTQMDSFFFMTDRHDSGFTAVRYIADLRLRQWRAYLQPLADRAWAETLRRALSCLVNLPLCLPLRTHAFNCLLQTRRFLTFPQALSSECRSRVLRGCSER
jgi:hypothetical protein